jgi:hypothetical protein
LPHGSGWIGRWSSHALPHARRPRVTGPQGADTELVRSEKRPLAAAKMPLTSSRGHFRLLRRWQWPARRQCRRWGQQVWAAAARRRTSRGAANEPGQGAESTGTPCPRRTGRAPRSITFVSDFDCGGDFESALYSPFPYLTRTASGAPPPLSGLYGISLNTEIAAFLLFSRRTAFPYSSGRFRAWPRPPLSG